jgi:proton-coupled amino acid transporter
VYIAALLLPLILLGCVPNLKYLAPVSMIANLFMAVGLGITIYYLVQDIPSASTRPHINASLNTIPQFFSIVIFAMEAIGVVSTNIIITTCLCNDTSVCP